MNSQPKDSPLVIIKPSRGLVALNLRSLWKFRELFYFLTWRDIKVRYKQTALGATWAVIQPFAAMVVFSLFFGKLAKIPSEGVPYPIFSYAALLPWYLFSQGVTRSAESIVNNVNMITKIYFPRIIVPSSAIIARLLDFAIAFLVLIGMMLYYRIYPTSVFPLTLLFLLLAIITSLGVGFWLSALNVQYRDVRHAVPFLIQIWLFATPVVYPTTLLPEKWRILYGLNPMVSVIEGFRWTLIGTTGLSIPVLIISTGAAMTIFVSGIFFFRYTERTFADII